MKGIFRRISQRRQKWCLENTNFTETTETLSNPARGWYQIYTFFGENEPDLEALKCCLKEDEMLALLFIDIGAFQNQDLSEECLNNIRRILTFFRDNQKDIILRITYDHEGKALEREPSLFSRVRGHLTQLSTILYEFGESIFVFQGMLVGNWGEMHTSRFLKEEHLQQLSEILKDGKGAQTYLAVRRPVYWRMLHQPGGDKDIVSADSMGLFDDGILGSESNLGTFGADSRQKVGWSKPWNREEELSFEENLCVTVPNGGEVVYDEAYIRQFSPEDILDVLKRMHITYLNRAHDIRLLRYWKTLVLSGSGVWSGKSIYDYVEAHMGYRFWIRDTKIEHEKTESGKTICRIAIEVQNVGFANLYFDVEVCVEWAGNHGQTKSLPLKTDMKKWESDSVHCITCTMEACEGMLYLLAKRKNDGRQIRFANCMDEQGRAILGFLKEQ